jgi:hypothetical protein
MSARLVSTLLAVTLLGACASAQRPFPMKEPLWEDPDQRPFAPRPAAYLSPWFWDGADNLFFRPISEIFKVDPPGDEAVNVNALDEVPDSSWFVNRLSRGPLTPEQIAKGPCDRVPLPPFKVTRAKPDGANPGFFVQDARGDRYLLKFDTEGQPERATAADVIGSRVYYAAGYYVPCANIVFFSSKDLSMPAAGEGGGGRSAVTPERIQATLERAYKAKSGLYRAHASLYVEGEPIGPWRYLGVREDDPNDVVPHEDRRELRGGRLLAAWLNHFDAREQNTLASFIPAGGDGTGYVRHYMLDFGDCLGSTHPLEGISRRLGHSYYFDFSQVGRDFVSLGLAQPPYERARFGPAGKVLAYYDVEFFSPDQWKPAYANPAFDRMTERDGAWMARILARFGDAHVEALVDTGRFDNRVVRDELVRIMKGRRDTILRRYLQGLSPLAHPTLAEAPGGTELCLEDLAVTGGVVGAGERRYTASAWQGTQAHPLAVGRGGAPEALCVRLPPQPRASPGSPAYVVVDVTAEGVPPARVHLYGLGGAQFRIVGLERPMATDPPRLESPRRATTVAGSTMEPTGQR